MSMPHKVFSALILLLTPAILLCQAIQFSPRVLDPEGLPIAGARVRIFGRKNQVIADEATDSHGDVVFSIPAGAYTAEISAPGFETQDVNLPSSNQNGQPVVFRLSLASPVMSVEVNANSEGQVGHRTLAASRLQKTTTPDLAEQLKSVPGVEAVRRGPIDLDPVVRGLRQTQVATIVDGTRTFAAGPARMDSELSHVDPSSVSQVTVVEGPYALTQGAGAMSAILVDTKPVPYFEHWRFGGSASTGYASNGSRRFADTTVYGATHTFGFRLFGPWNQGNWYNAGERDGVAEQVPGRYKTYLIGGELRFNPTPHQQINVSSTFDDQSGIDYPGRLLNANFLITRSYKGAYYWRPESKHISLVNVRLYANDIGHRMSNDGKPTAEDMPGRTPPFALDIQVPTKSYTWGGAGNVTLQRFAGWNFLTGVDFYNLNQDANRTVSRKSTGMLMFQDIIWPDVTMRDQGFYLNASREIERLELSATARLDTVQANVGEQPSAFFLENTTGSLHQNEYNVSFSAGGIYQMEPGAELTFGAGRSVRTANALERYSDRFPSSEFETANEFLGDPAIQPEIGYEGDLGLRLRFGKVQSQVGGFYRTIDRFITAVPAPGLPKFLPLDPNGVYRYVNGDHANYSGVDYSLRLPVTSNLELSSEGSYIRAEEVDRSLSSLGVDEPLYGIPPLEAIQRVRYTTWHGRVWGQFSERSVANQDRVSYTRNEITTPGFSTFGVKTAAQLPRNAMLYFGVDNLGDKYYSEHLSSLNPYTGQPVPELGRTYYASLTLRWP
jgi:iron complex outermembrane receptor protein